MNGAGRDVDELAGTALADLAIQHEFENAFGDEERFLIGLLYSLSLPTGIETLVVLKDVCGLENKAAEDVTLSAARTLLAGATSRDS